MGTLKSPIVITCVLIALVDAANRKVISSDLVSVNDANVLEHNLDRDLNPLPHYLTYDLPLPYGETIKLTLTKRSELSPTDFKVKFHRAELDGLEYKSLDNVGFYYDPTTQAVLSITSEAASDAYKRTLTGTLVYSDRAFEITPASQTSVDVTDFIKSRGIDSSSVHQLHHLTEVELPSHEEIERQTSNHENESRADSNGAEENESESKTQNEELERLLKELLRDKVRVKRMTSYYQEEFNVEIIFLVDYSIYKYWLDINSGSHRRAVYDIHFFFSHIFHGIYMAYTSISYQSYHIKITPWLKEIRICTTPEEGWMTENAKVTTTKLNLDRSEDNLRVYIEDEGLSWADPDHLMLWSRYTLVIGNKEGLLGLAPDICSVCKKGQGLSQCFEYGLFSWTTGAHELAHTLGAQHDKKAYGCPAADRYLMTPFSMALGEQTYRNSFTFSWCSIQMMKMCFIGKQYGGVSPVFPRACVYDKICEHGHPIEDDLTKLPGQMYNLREQCQLTFGDSRASYDENCNSGSDICKSMKCRLLNQCTDNGIGELRAAMGTPCDTSGNKICFKGECVESNTVKYAGDSSPQSCSLINKVPKGCYDNQQYLHDDELTCPEIALRKPWMCFNNNDIKQNCRASCFKWGLIRVKQPLCNFVEIETQSLHTDDEYDVPARSDTAYISKLKFDYCGYQWGKWWVSCPGDMDVCIPMQYACNGVDDCPDGKDEERDWCFKVPSGVTGMVRCPGDPHSLIYEDQLCDGHADCAGGRDEDKTKCDHFTYCDKKGTEVSCPNNPKQCVPLQFTCDGREDCGVEELAGDENPEFCASLCPPGQIRCPQMKTGADCIFGQWACDGRDDCGDNTDENPQWCEQLMSLPPIKCPQGQVHCSTAPYICIDEGYICDGIEDCPNEGDEQHCSGKRDMSSVKRLERLLNEKLEEQQRKQIKLNMEKSRLGLKLIDKKLYHTHIQERIYKIPHG